MQRSLQIIKNMILYSYIVFQKYSNITSVDSFWF